MTKPKPPHLKQKPGPKPGSKRTPKAAAPAAAGLVATVATQEPPRSHDALQRHRNIADMPEPELRVYARQVGISAREATELTVERLRANCVLAVHNYIEQFD